MVVQRAKLSRKGAPGDCGSFVGVCPALLCLVALWGRFATDIPRAKWLIIKYLKLRFMLPSSHNPKVADSNQSPAANWFNELRAPQVAQVFGLCRKRAQKPEGRLVVQISPESLRL
jgi:hypothetical protein